MANWIGEERYDAWHPHRERKGVDWFSLGVIAFAFVALTLVAWANS